MGDPGLERGVNFESIDSLKYIADSIVDGIAILNEANRFIFVNKSKADIYGYGSPSELIGKTWHQLYPKKEQERLQKEIASGFELNGKWKGEALACRKNGVEVHVELSLSTIDKNRYICISRDITDRKLFEFEAKRFRELIDQTRDTIFIVDPSTSRFVDINESACRNLLYTRKELLSLKVLDVEVGLPEDFDWEEHVGRLEQSGGLVVVGVHRRKDGTRFPVEVNIKLVSMEDKQLIIAVARDLSEIKRNEDLTELRNSFENAVVGISVIDRKGRYISVNSEYTKFTGFSKGELIGRDWQLTVYPDDVKLINSKYEMMFEMGKSVSQVRGVKKDGAIFYKEVTMVKKVDKNGEFWGHYHFVKDITEYKLAQKALKETTVKLAAANARLDKLSILDPLTEQLNRRGLQRSVAIELARSRRDQSDLNVILVDLDDFKLINDKFGHAVGDIVLKEIAEKLNKILRATDYVARIGGDEFMLLLPQTRYVEAMKIAEKVRIKVANSSVILASGERIKVTSSIGVVIADPDSASIDELLARTHMVLRKSKELGKNMVIGEKTGVKPKTLKLDRGSVVRELSEGGGLYAVMQPIMDITSGEVAGYELLSRSSIKGFEMPAEFFHICFEANVLTLVDHRCLRTCIAASKLIKNGFTRHFNIFPSTLIDIPVEEIIRDFGEEFERSRYCLEISEQQIIGNPGYLYDSVMTLKKSGIKIAIDDVGFGHSCLESLIVLEPDIIKIDKRNISGVSSDMRRERSLRRLVNVVESLGSEIIVAEGIESKEDLDFLKELGVKYVQGYLYGKPVPITNGENSEAVAL